MLGTKTNVNISIKKDEEGQFPVDYNDKEETKNIKTVVNWKNFIRFIIKKDKIPPELFAASKEIKKFLKEKNNNRLTYPKCDELPEDLDSILKMFGVKNREVILKYFGEDFEIEEDKKLNAIKSVPQSLLRYFYVSSLKILFLFILNKEKMFLKHYPPTLVFLHDLFKKWKVPPMWLSAQNTEGRQKQAKVDMNRSGTHENLFNSARTLMTNQLVALINHNAESRDALLKYIKEEKEKRTIEKYSEDNIIFRKGFLTKMMMSCFKLKVQSFALDDKVKETCWKKVKKVLDDSKVAYQSFGELESNFSKAANLLRKSMESEKELHIESIDKRKFLAVMLKWKCEFKESFTDERSNLICYFL